MSGYESFNTRKRKLRYIWEQNQKRLQEAELLDIQKVIDFSMAQTNKEVIDFTIFQDQTVSNIFFSQTYEFAIINIPQVSLASAYIIERLYRTSSQQSAIFDQIRHKNYFAKIITNGVIFQVPLSFSSFNNLTLRELKIYMQNPNQISSIQKIII